MLFRYDFGKKPDLSRFRKQAEHYIGNMRELSYNLFLQDFIIEIAIATPDDQTSHVVSIEFSEITRDDNQIASSHKIIPMIDTRFNEIKMIQDMFPRDHYVASFQSNSAQNTVEKICQLVRLVSKINSLRAFV